MPYIYLHIMAEGYILLHIIVDPYRLSVVFVRHVPDILMG